MPRYTWVCRVSSGRQPVVIADRHARELAHRLDAAGGLQLGVEILDQESDQLLSVGPCLLRGGIRGCRGGS